MFEGGWFYNGFPPIFALQRRGLMKSTAEQLQYIMRDEVMHCGFGIRVARWLGIERDGKVGMPEGNPLFGTGGMKSPVWGTG